MTSSIWSSKRQVIRGKALPSPFKNVKYQALWNFLSLLVSYQAEFLQKFLITFDHFGDFFDQ